MWTVLRETGRASAFHAREPPAGAGRSAWIFRVDRPALVLGSTQPDDVIAPGVTEGADLDVVRRGSGGGAVLLVPGEVVWVDLILPAGDPLWHDDIGQSMAWMGEAWVGALASLGIDATAHLGPPVGSRWRDLVCFAGLGPGEVTVGGRKAVGLSQRRTRRAARFQSAALLRWDPGALLERLALGPEARERARRDLATEAVGLACPAADLEEALVAHLP